MHEAKEKLLSRTRWDILGEGDLAAVALVEGRLVEGAMEYFMKEGFVNIVVPHITRATGACENIDTLFEVDYFGNKGYLVQTGQLYLEAFIPHFRKVCCIGPSFRAEPEVDARHLTEFPLLEIEFATPEKGGLEQLMGHMEGIVHSMLSRVLKEKGHLEGLGADAGRLRKARPPFRKMAYREALEILNSLGHRLSFGDDLKHAHEQDLASHLGSRPVFITHYPKEIKFFNMRENPEDPEVVNSTDLILPCSGEAAGAAEREHVHGKLLKRLKESQMLRMLEARGGGIRDFEWYLRLIREQPIPHAGCGIGLNRVTQFALGSGDIRSCSAFPMNRENLM